jgi:hypothetical protein
VHEPTGGSESDSGVEVLGERRGRSRRCRRCRSRPTAAARFGLTRKPMRASPLASKRVSASKGLAIDVGRGELRCSCGVKKLDSAGAGCW